MKYRMERINSEIKNTLLKIISQMNDNRLSNSFVTISEVKTSPDLFSSKISVTSMKSSDKENREIINVLNSSKGYIKRELASQIKMKRVPDLYFVEDKTEEKADKIEQLLSQIATINSRK
jgi:ribosome-binding factor A